MSNYWPGFWTDLQTAITTAWHEFESPTSVIFRASQTTRINWQNLVETFQQTAAGGLQLPYCVVQIGPAIPMLSMGINNAMKNVDVTVYYIFDTRTTSNIGATAEAKVYALANELETATYQYSFQCFDECTTDVTESNPANVVFLGQDLPLFAASVSALLLVGETDVG